MTCSQVGRPIPSRVWHRFSQAPEPKGHEHPDWWAVELFLGADLLERPSYIARCC